MNGRAKTWALVVGSMAVAFAAGWLAAASQNVNKLGLGEITANRWMGDLGLLVGNVKTLKPVDPKTTQLLIRFGLDTDSATLAQLYDGMSPSLQKTLVFYIPLGRAVARAQPGAAFGFQDRYALLIFVDCMQQVRVHGGSVDACFKERKGRK